MPDHVHEGAAEKATPAVRLLRSYKQRGDLEP
jgi:hypothetical protein